MQPPCIWTINQAVFGTRLSVQDHCQARGTGRLSSQPEADQGGMGGELNLPNSLLRGLCVGWSRMAVPESWATC